jgi:hypothetical protein
VLETRSQIVKELLSCIQLQSLEQKKAARDILMESADKYLKQNADNRSEDTEL